MLLDGTSTKLLAYWYKSTNTDSYNQFYYRGTNATTRGKVVELKVYEALSRMLTYAHVCWRWDLKVYEALCLQH